MSAAMPRYGPLAENPAFTEVKAAALGIYCALDARVSASEPAAKAAIDRADVVHDLVFEPDADHALFNDTGPRYTRL